MFVRNRLLFVFGLAASIAALAWVVLTPAPAHAAVMDVKVDAYVTGYLPNGKSVKIRNAGDAQNFLNTYCSQTWQPVMVAAYPSNVKFNTSTGGMTYDSNVLWRSCSGGTRAFAVTGYPQAAPGSIATCPYAGTYGVESGTYDCVKYTGSDLGDMQGYAALGCAAGSNWSCVSGNFASQIQRTDKEPPTSVSSTRQSMSGQVPNWPVVSKTSGLFPFQRSQAYCTFWKWNSDGSSGWGDCVQIYIKISWTVYDYTLTPSVTTSSTGVVDPGSTVTVTPKVDNTGPTPSQPTDWQLSLVTIQPGGVVPSGGDNTTTPCVQYKNPQTSCTDIDSSTKSGKQVFSPPSKTLSDVLSTIPDLPVGTKICYGLSVKPFELHPSSPSSALNVWRHSSLTCIVVAKSPVVQVRGGDLIVGRNQAGSEVRTNTKTSGGKAYGSWSEYAIIPSGTVFGMASAAGYSGGVTGLAATKQQCQVSLLTFTNTTMQPITKKPECTGATANFGGYQLGGTIPSIMTRFPVSTAKTSLTVPATNTLVLDNSIDSGSYSITNPNFSLQSNGLISSGKWIVVNAPNSTVTITGDLRIDSAASLTKQQDIPQIVVIAKNIIIKDTVSQVDAWLLAVGTGTDGYISTCDTTATPNASQCTTKLTVNGPLQANHLYMRRTAGAGTGANSGDPAEVFNLRADAYFWATSAAPSNNRVPTVSSKELPPRF